MGIGDYSVSIGNGPSTCTKLIPFHLLIYELAQLGLQAFANCCSAPRCGVE